MRSRGLGDVYKRQDPYRPPAEGPRVAVLLGDEPDTAAGGVEAARRAEAQALAALLVEMHEGGGDRWTVQDRAAPADDEVWRAPRWGDVAVLFRATTGLETYEQALREAGVPYRVDGGTAYFARREVDDALLCLRAVDDPSDGPAVYAALHSTLFGFSDDELFLFWAAGGRFDLFAEQPEGHAAVAEALVVLRDLHSRRAACEPFELAAELLRRTKAVEVLAASGAGGPQAIANLEKLVDRARAFSGAGGRGLGAFLAWAAEAGDAAGEQESQVDDDGDVVRLLTIHKAKGLEYPIVVVAGGALGTRGGGGEPIVDRERRRLAIKLKAELPGAAARDLEPERYVALREREKEMEASERRRLLYVAATRARDRLVVTCFGRLWNKDGSRAAVLLGPMADALPAPAPLEEAYEDGGVLVLPPAAPRQRAEEEAAPPDADLAGARSVWGAQREELLERAGRAAPATSPSGLEHVDKQVRSGGPGVKKSRYWEARRDAMREEMLRDIREARAQGNRADEATAERRSRGDQLRRGNPYYKIFETADGYIALACLNNRLRRAAAGVLGVEDPRLAGDQFNVEQLGPDETLVIGELIAAIFSSRPTDEWVDLFAAAGVPSGAVKMTEELFDDPHVEAEGFLVDLEHPTLGTVKQANTPVRMSGGETGTRRSSPALGQHTEEFLGELGFTGDEIEALETGGVVRSWKRGA